MASNCVPWSKSARKGILPGPTGESRAMPQATKPVNKPMEPPPNDQVLSQRPTVLVATSSRWYPTARLTMALASAGCKVEAVCPVRHPLLKTNAVCRAHVYRGLAPLVSLARAISRSQPDFLVSGDDLTTQHLHRLYAQEKRRGKSEFPICALIERSLGSPESFPSPRREVSIHGCRPRSWRSCPSHSSH